MNTALAQDDTVHVLPPKLKPGDRVRLVSPASTPTREGVAQCVAIFEGWGLKPEVAPNAFNEYGYLAGTTGTHRDELPDDLHQAFWAQPDNAAAMALLGWK